MYDVLIRNGELVQADSTTAGDIAIRDGRICALLAPGEAAEAKRVIDAEGLKVMPGVIDAHMHTEAPFQGLTGQLTFFQQSACAAHGGVTTFMDFANARKGWSVLEACKARLEEMAVSAIDYSVHGKFIEADETVLADIPELIRLGVPTFKLFMTYRREGVMADDDTLLRVFEQAARHNGMPLVHAESNAIVEARMDRLIADGHVAWKNFAEAKPEACEIEAFARAAYLAEAVGSPLLVVHTTCGPCLDIAEAAQRRGVPLYVETCPHYLTLFKDLYDDPDTGHLAICSPPLRGPEQVDPLWDGMHRRVIAITGSDDCTFTRAEKERFLDRDASGRLIQDFTKVVNGLSGLETRLPILMTEGVAKGRISLNDLVALTSTNIAMLMGCHPQKGSLAPGADADVILFDPDAEWTITADALHNGAGYTFFEGYKARGKVIATLSRGEVIMENDVFSGAKGRGRFVHRALNPDICRSHRRML